MKVASEVYAGRLVGEVHARSGDVSRIVLAISLICNVNGDIQFVCSVWTVDIANQIHRPNDTRTFAAVSEF